MKINDFNKYGMHANYEVHVMLTKIQKERLKALAESSGFDTVSSYVRFRIFNPSIDMKLNRIIELLKKRD